jgi:hypothetical protein
VFGSALLGSAGSAVATVVTGWLSPVLICMSILLMGRSFYVLYVRKIGSPATAVITWCALVFVVGFWTWYLFLGGRGVMNQLFQPASEA